MATLFLLNPNFKDIRISDTDKFYCPHCAMIEGVLQYYPYLKDEIQIQYVDFPRPRPKIIELLGEDHQGCPCLVIERTEVENTEIDLASFQRSGDYFFANETGIIAKYLAQRYKIGLPHP